MYYFHGKKLYFVETKMSDSRAKSPGFDIRSGHLRSFPLPLIQERQLSVTGEGMRTYY